MEHILAVFPAFLQTCEFPRYVRKMYQALNDNHVEQKCALVMDGPDVRFMREIFVHENIYRLYIFACRCSATTREEAEAEIQNSGRTHLAGV